jgi:hypothetical protein
MFFVVPGVGNVAGFFATCERYGVRKMVVFYNSAPEIDA